jgi:hypothetical protein
MKWFRPSNMDLLKSNFSSYYDGKLDIKNLEGNVYDFINSPSKMDFLINSNSTIIGNYHYFTNENKLYGITENKIFILYKPTDSKLPSVVQQILYKPTDSKLPSVVQKILLPSREKRTGTATTTSSDDYPKLEKFYPGGGRRRTRKGKRRSRTRRKRIRR